MKHKKTILGTIAGIVIITIVGIITYHITFTPKLKVVTSAQSKLDKQIDKAQVNLSAQLTILPNIISANEPIDDGYKASKAEIKPQIAKFNKANSQFKTNNTNVAIKSQALQKENDAITAIISQIQNKYANKMFNGDSGKDVAELTKKQNQLESIRKSLNADVDAYNTTISKNEYASAAKFKKYKPAQKLKTSNTIVSPIQSLIP